MPRKARCPNCDEVMRFEETPPPTWPHCSAALRQQTRPAGETDGPAARDEPPTRGDDCGNELDREAVEEKLQPLAEMYGNISDSIRLSNSGDEQADAKRWVVE